MNAKKFYATFVSLMLAIILLIATVMTLQAAYPGVGLVYPGFPVYPAHPGKLMVVEDPLIEYPGPYYYVYQGMWDLISPKLDSTLGFSCMYWIIWDDWDYYDLIWDLGWQSSSQNITPYVLVEPGCWDLTNIEWWLMPTGMLWMDSLILSESIPPSGGRNIFPYLNSKSDDLYWKMQSSFDANQRKYWADEWQAELMRNPVSAVLYYPEIYDMLSSYVEGWYGTVGWYDIRNLAIDQPLVDTINGLGYIVDPGDYTRLKAGTLKYGVTEDWWNYNPMFCDTSTEEIMANLVGDTLYGMSLSVWPPAETAADPTKYVTAPVLADGMPQYPVDDTHAIINLKTGITWSDGEAFDADDVVWTLNQHLDPTVKTTARGEFAPIVSAVNKINASAVELVLHRPYVDLEDILSNSWGLNILPEHYFSGIPPGGLKGHLSNTDAATSMLTPTIGAYNLTSWTATTLTFEKNPDYWGYAAPYNYGPHGIDKIILVQIKYAGERFNSILRHEIDFAEYPTIHIAAFAALIGRPDLDVFQRPYTASNGVWFNFNNPYISNRYVRLAISYAIPYDDIRTFMQSYGVSNWIAGGTFVHPWQYYGGIQLFNTAMPAYYYDATMAQAYLDMWKLSRIMHAPNDMSGLDWTQGPVGDADFSGVVNTDDFSVWVENYGNAEDAHDFLPGNDEDADFNNDNVVNTDDFTLWANNYGAEYPFPGAY